MPNGGTVTRAGALRLASVIGQRFGDSAIASVVGRFEHVTVVHLAAVDVQRYRRAVRIRVGERVVLERWNETAGSTALGGNPGLFRESIRVAVL